MRRQGVVCDTVTQSALIRATETGTQLEQALQLLVAVWRQGVAPNIVTYSALISAFQRSSSPKRALELHEAMWL